MLRSLLNIRGNSSYKYMVSIARRRLSSEVMGPQTTNRVLDVVIVGRPNVGKSTLFNRLTKSNMAIVSPVPGTTRDRKEGWGTIAGLRFKVTDTGGLDDRGDVSNEIKKQVGISIRKADLILFMTDARAGLTPIDRFYAQWLRKTLGLAAAENKTKNSNARIAILANKAEGTAHSEKMLQTYEECLQMNFGDPIPMSASHGEGISDLAQVMVEEAKKRGLDTDAVSSNFSDSSEFADDRDGPIALEDRVIQLVIMGRPNAGKSTLLNAICGEERSITGPMAGLTR